MNEQRIGQLRRGACDIKSQKTQKAYFFVANEYQLCYDNLVMGIRGDSDAETHDHAVAVVSAAVFCFGDFILCCCSMTWLLQREFQ